MTALPGILRCLSRLRALFYQGKANRDFTSEVESHIELLTERFVQQGMSTADAASAARRQFGNAGLVEQRQREARTYVWIDTVLQDVRYGMRMLAKSPITTVIAVASLGLGIGANTAIFALAKAALLDALAVPHPEQLRLLAYAQDDRSVIRNDWGDFYTDAQGHTIAASFSWPVYQEMQRKSHTPEDLFAFVDLSQFEHLSATINGHAEAVSGELVSGNFFDAMGVAVQLGRPIQPADDTSAVAVISDAFWRRQFDRSPSVLGKTINVNLVPVTIIGVAPPSFTGASHVQTPQDLFLPFRMQPAVFPRDKGSLLSDPDTWWLQIMVRRKPGTSEAAAQASLGVDLNQAIQSTMTVKAGQSVPQLLLLPGARGWSYTEQQLEHPMPMLLAVAGLVLLLACANVANLLLARFSSRQREISIRFAMGAARTRVARQMLIESLCLSALGSGAGLLLGFVGRNLLPRLFSVPWGPLALNTRFDWQVFAFTLTISVLTGIGFGVGPALQAMRADANSGLKDQAPTIAGAHKGLAAKALVVVQIALCMLLLVSAGLFVRTLRNLQTVDKGFNSKGLLLFALEPPALRYPTPKNMEVLHRIEEKIGALPGVESVTLSREALLAQSGSNSDFIVEGRAKDLTRNRRVSTNAVGQSFFSTMNIPILYGRPFDVRDTPGAPPVAIVNRSLAQREFAGRNPIGSSFRMKEGGEPYEIVGVSADAKYAWIRDDAPPTFYILYTQQKDSRGRMTYEVRTRGNPKDIVAAIRQTIESIDDDLPLVDVRTQREQIDATLAPERSFAAVTSGFGLLGMVLASIGVYGVIAAGVSRRVNEIGVRMALGARRETVLRMVLAETMSLALTGIAVGIGAAVILARFLSSLLFGLKPTDAVTLGSAAILLSIAAFLAGWSPARRASRIQPIQALRHE
jgi:predicted permease